MDLHTDRRCLMPGVTNFNPVNFSLCVASFQAEAHVLYVQSELVHVQAELVCMSSTALTRKRVEKKCICTCMYHILSCDLLIESVK